MPYKQQKCIFRGRSTKRAKCSGGCGCGGSILLHTCTQYPGKLVSIGECRNPAVAAYCVKCTIYQLPGQAPPANQDQGQDAIQQPADQ